MELQEVFPCHAVCSKMSYESPLVRKLKKAVTVDFKKHLAEEVATMSGKCLLKVRGRFASPGTEVLKIFQTLGWEPPRRSWK